MIREKIKEAIKERNIPIRQIAADCSILPTSISSYISGNRGLSYKNIDRLIQYLGLQFVPKKDFHFKSDFMDRQEEEREAMIAARRGA